jgi:hypothetical protein
VVRPVGGRKHRITPNKSKKGEHSPGTFPSETLVFERADRGRIVFVCDDKGELRSVGQSGKGGGGKKNHRTKNDSRQSRHEAP